MDVLPGIFAAFYIGTIIYVVSLLRRIAEAVERIDRKTSSSATN